jgi:hypothetical protein
MYVEAKGGSLDGEGRIGWVELSRSGRTYRYAGRDLAKTKSGYKFNCVDAQTGETYWVSGPRRDGADKLYGGIVQIDEDARAAYWTQIRQAPASIASTSYRAGASTRTSPSVRRNEQRIRGSAR